MELKQLNVADVVESKTNPRAASKDEFAVSSFNDLVKSVDEKGILQPILVRKVGNKFEVIAGSRRLRAVKQLKRDTIPAQIAIMTDDEAREAQIVENLQRSDINPIDEAAAFADLLKGSKRSTAEIAAKVGKSESYVRQRLALSTLEPKIAAKARSGELPIAHAVLIGRLDKSEQAGAYKFASDRWNGVVALKDLREHITNKIFHAAMKSPPWKDDAAAQAEIAKITGIKGGETTLFGEKLAGTIEDPAEYARAAAAFLTIKIREFRDAGKPITLVSDQYGSSSKDVKSRSDYNLVADVKGCKSGHDAIVVEGANLGKILKICTDVKCKAHHPYSYERNENPVEKRASRKKEIAREKAKRAKDDAAMQKAVSKISWPLSEKHLTAFIEIALRGASHDVQQGIVKRRGLVPITTKDKYGNHRHYERTIAALAGKLKPKEKVGLLFELLVSSYSPHYNDSRNAAIKKI